MFFCVCNSSVVDGGIIVFGAGEAFDLSLLMASLFKHLFSDTGLRDEWTLTCTHAHTKQGHLRSGVVLCVCVCASFDCSVVFFLKGFCRWRKEGGTKRNNRLLLLLYIHVCSCGSEWGFHLFWLLFAQWSFHLVFLFLWFSDKIKSKGGSWRGTLLQLFFLCFRGSVLNERPTQTKKWVCIWTSLPSSVSVFFVSCLFGVVSSSETQQQAGKPEWKTNSFQSAWQEPPKSNSSHCPFLLFFVHLCWSFFSVRIGSA